MMFLSRTQPRPVSVSFFLNPHGPLSFTSHCPSRSAFPPFRFFFLFLYPHSPSLVYGFPGFSFLFWSVFLSSIRSFLSFCFLFLCPFSLLFHACWRWGGIFRAKGSGGVPIATLWQRMGAGLCCPTTTPGWLASGRGWQGAAPLTSHHQGAWGFESSARHAARRN